jgi:hypothetical protein
MRVKNNFIVIGIQIVLEMKMMKHLWRMSEK